jgi:hypothetical protein
MGGDGELRLWLQERIAELEEELSYLRRILEALGGQADPPDPRRARPGERVEEVKVGRRKIARVFKGEDYVRLAPLEALALPKEARSYLENIVSEIRAEQARGWEDATAKLEIREDPVKGLVEARIEGLRNALEVIKAKAALKHVADVAWHYTRAASRSRGGDGA